MDKNFCLLMSLILSLSKILKKKKAQPAKLFRNSTLTRSKANIIVINTHKTGKFKLYSENYKIEERLSRICKLRF